MFSIWYVFKVQCFIYIVNGVPTFLKLTYSEYGLQTELMEKPLTEQTHSEEVRREGAIVRGICSFFNTKVLFWWAYLEK